MKHTPLSLISRTNPVFAEDWQNQLPRLADQLSDKRVLIVGGAGSIGSTVVEILLSFTPRALHVVDINENGLADLVRQIRSSIGYSCTDFRTICFDLLEPGADFMNQRHGPYDIILNFAAVKHVRSEKDEFTLSRMLAVNVRLMEKLSSWAADSDTETIFSVSTDKAANPANLMGASKRLMEIVGFAYGNGRFSTARFANVAFSNGSLLKAFWDRLDRGQPLSAPSNIKRFFITHEEAARLCLLAAIAGKKGTVAIPRAPGEIELTSFVDVATSVLASRGLEPLICESEDEARRTKPAGNRWPCYFFESDTTGEKPYEEFIATGEELVDSPFQEISLIESSGIAGTRELEAIKKMDPLTMDKAEIVNRIADIVPGFEHIETGKNLDQRM